MLPEDQSVAFFGCVGSYFPFWYYGFEWCQIRHTAQFDKKKLLEYGHTYCHNDSCPKSFFSVLWYMASNLYGMLLSIKGTDNITIYNGFGK